MGRTSVSTEPTSVAQVSAAEVAIAPAATAIHAVGREASTVTKRVVQLSADCNMFLRSLPAHAGTCRRNPLMASTVNARIPLSLLEALRRIDTPLGPAETEYVAELRNKRLGLSDTVYTQIRRYNDALKRGQRIPIAEAEGLGTLIGRRPDAATLFQNAGHILAGDVYQSISSTTRGTIRALPGFISRPMALKQIRVVVEKFLDGTLERTGSSLSLKVPSSVTVNGASKSAGCVFYETAFRELLRMLIDSGDQIEHVHCAQRGEGFCEWRAEWRTGH